MIICNDTSGYFFLAPKKCRFIAILLILLSTLITYSQPKKNTSVEPEDADFLFKYQNYKDAISIYLQLLRSDPDNYLYNYRLGICYLNTHLNKSQAVKYFKACTTNPKADDNLWFMLGKAFHINHQFDSALTYYNIYKEIASKKKTDKDKVELAIQQANNAKQLIINPVKVSFTNLGPNVNSEYPDYFPWVTADEKKLFFTSRRKGVHAHEIETDGYYSSDIFMSEDINGKWEKVKNLPGPGINTNLDEEIVGMRPDGEELIIYKDHIKEFGDLYYSLKLSANFGRLEKYGPQINAELEYSGSIAEDDQTFFFVRKSNLINSNQDIFYSRRLPNGKWGLPISAGPVINTSYNEDFPYLSMDGKTLYFSSEGHNSMGGYDLFKCEWNNENNAFGEPVNLGFPVNTADDERNIAILPDNRAGYISTSRKDGLGDLDIYRVKFEDHEQPYTFIRLNITYSDSNYCSNYHTNISITKKNEGKILSKYKPNSITGCSLLALTPGSYDIYIESEGYGKLKDTIEISDIGAIQHEERKNFTLQKTTDR